jgi:hypothetical protein
MLSRTRLGSGPGFAVEEVRCARLATPGWSSPEAGGAYMLVFVRVGLFRRRVGGAEAVLDPAVGYWQRPGEEQQVAHPLGDGDVCTAITLSEELLAALAGGVATVPAAPVLTGDVLDLAYRALTTRAAAVPARWSWASASRGWRLRRWRSSYPSAWPAAGRRPRPRAVGWPTRPARC